VGAVRETAGQTWAPPRTEKEIKAQKVHALPQRIFDRAPWSCASSARSPQRRARSTVAPAPAAPEA